MQSDNILMEDACRVHDIVLDFIRSLSSEVKFVTIQDTAQYNTCSPSRSRSRSRSDRRLAIHDGTVEHVNMGHVRSLNAIGLVGSVLPPLSSFKVLRVLALERCDIPAGGCRFNHLGNLVQLRYLGLEGTYVTELPTDIGHDLKFLQTLDIRCTGIKEIPSSVGELTKLMCLRALDGTRMMARIGKLTSLEELELHHVETSPGFTMDLGELVQLRVVKISFDEMDKSLHSGLVKSMCNLRKIQTLEIELESDDPLEVGDWEEWAPPSALRQWSHSGMILPRRPSWMNTSCAPHVSYLMFDVAKLKVRDVQILGRLLSLRFLWLTSYDAVTLWYNVDSNEFQNLVYLCIEVEILCGKGALPMLEELECEASVGKDVGLVGNMPFLKKVTYNISCKGYSEEQVEKAEAALRHAAETHPNRPKLEIERNDEESDDDNNDNDDNEFEEVPSSDQNEDEDEESDNDDYASEEVSSADEDEYDEDKDGGSEEEALGADEELDDDVMEKTSHGTVNEAVTTSQS